LVVPSFGKRLKNMLPLSQQDSISLAFKKALHLAMQQDNTEDMVVLVLVV